MRGFTFKERIREIDFSFEKLMLKNNEVIFFVSCDMGNERSFFMSKDKNGDWLVLYHTVLGRELLRMESQLSEVLKQKGY